MNIDVNNPKQDKFMYKLNKIMGRYIYIYLKTHVKNLYSRIISKSPKKKTTPNVYQW